MLDWTVWKIM